MYITNSSIRNSTPNSPDRCKFYMYDMDFTFDTPTICRMGKVNIFTPTVCLWKTHSATFEKNTMQEPPNVLNVWTLFGAPQCTIDYSETTSY